MAIEGDRGLRGLLRGVLEAPAAGLDDLPELLAALEHDDSQARIGAAWAVCAVAAARPDSAASIRRQLDHRSTTAAALAAEWIDRECDAAAQSGDDGTDAGATAGADAGSIAGATAKADAGADASPSDADAGTDGLGATLDGHDDSSDRASSDDGAGADDGGSSTGSASASRPPGTDRVVERGRFAIELDRTALDGLDVIDRVATDRYSWTYEAMATIDAAERAVLVRTYRPPDGARLSRFADAFEEQVDAWAAVDDHDGVLAVFDRGRRPHPWIVVGYAPETLRTAGRLPTETALAVVEDAARALAHAHDRGVTHRSLDPRSVALDSGEVRPRGRLLNFGVVDAFRAVDGPLPLDSRFAAPELFDGEPDAVDRLSDVYQLGAVCYTALTGRPPYDASLVDRGGPTGVPLEPPSSVVGDLPPAVDDVVETAMATDRSSRYGSAGELADALARARDDPGSSG